MIKNHKKIYYLSEEDLKNFDTGSNQYIASLFWLNISPRNVDPVRVYDSIRIFLVFLFSNSISVTEVAYLSRLLDNYIGKMKQSAIYEFNVTYDVHIYQGNFEECMIIKYT